MTAFKYLTDAEARTLTRGQLLDRVEAQQAYYERKRRKTRADEAAMDELGRIMRRYLSIEAGFDAAFATLGGYTGPSYWDTRPADVPGPAGPGTWPSSAASPQEQTAAVLARLNPRAAGPAHGRSRRAAVTAEAVDTGQAPACRRTRIEGRCP